METQNLKLRLKLLKKEELQQIITELNDTAKESAAYLSQSTDYARGYKDGIYRMKEIMETQIENKINKLISQNK